MSEEAKLDEFFEGEKEPTNPQDDEQHLPEIDSIPPDWNLVTVDDIADELIGGGTPSKSNEEYWDGEIPWASVKDLNGIELAETEDYITEAGVENSATNLIPKDSIVISTRMTVGEPFLNRVEMAINQDMKAVIPDIGQVNPLFFVYSLWNKDPYLKSLGRGTTVDGITTRDLALTHLGLPSLPEQRKIATVLHTVDRAIEKTEEVISQVETIHKGFVQELFESDQLTEINRTESEQERRESILKSRREVWADAEKERQQRNGDFTGSIDKSKYSQPLDLATQRLPKLPEGWLWTSLDTFVAYDIDYRGKTPPYSDSGIPVISSGNIQNGEIVFDDEKYVSEETYDDWLDRGVPKEGDLLITTEAPVGKVTLYPEGTYLPTRRIITFRTVGVENRYLQAAIRHPYVQNYLTAQSGGSTVGRILKDHLLKTPIPLPPEEEQQQIADTLKDFDKRIANESEYKSRLQRLKRGLMQDLLSGTVRTTDTNIEVPEEVAQHG
jgi:type I restriction enzyme S subunit